MSCYVKSPMLCEIMVDICAYILGIHLTDEDIAGEQEVWLDARSLRSLVQSEIESTRTVWRNRQRAI